jgi:hypothetical protein
VVGLLPGLDCFVAQSLGVAQRLDDGGRALVEHVGDALPQRLAGQRAEQHEGDADPEGRIREDAAAVTFRGVRRPSRADHRLSPLIAAVILPASAP